jgi:hypothetical protein
VIAAPETPGTQQAKENNMTTIPAIDTNIWASVVKPGMVIDNDGENFPVAQVVENYSSFTFTFTDLTGRELRAPYATLLRVLGYFNPE